MFKWLHGLFFKRIHIHQWEMIGERIRPAYMAIGGPQPERRKIVIRCLHCGEVDWGTEQWALEYFNEWDGRNVEGCPQTKKEIRYRDSLRLLPIAIILFVVVGIALSIHNQHECVHSWIPIREFNDYLKKDHVNPIRYIVIRCKKCNKTKKVRELKALELMPNWNGGRVEQGKELKNEND